MTKPQLPPVSESRRTRGGHVATGTAAQRRAKSGSPATAKSVQTRQALVDAAERVFIRKGYLNARVSDIVKEAELAHGSFYTYFPSKLEVFQHIVDNVGALIAQAVASGPDDVPGDYYGNLQRANRRYIDLHMRNDAILALIDQVATADPVIHEARINGRRAHVNRIGHIIQSLQNRGLADPTLDPHTTAGALVSMLASFAHWASLDPEEYDPEQAAETVTQIWTRALQLDTPPTSP